MIFPGVTFDPLITITPFSMESCGNLTSLYVASNGSIKTVTSATWPTANKAFFYPFLLGKTISLTTLFTGTGNVTSGNIDVGIYDTGGNRLVSSGSTAQDNSTTGNCQLYTVSAITLGPGVYYMALAMDNTTGKILR